MGSSRLLAAGAAAAARPDKKTGSPSTSCPASCADQWEEIAAEVKKIVDLEDPFERNAKISAAYAAMNLRKPALEWVGLAAIVSKQAGCAMKHADATAAKSLDLAYRLAAPPSSAALAALVPVAFAKTAKSALVEANKRIFSDIYPVMRFYEKYDAGRFAQCSGKRPGGGSVPSQLLEAVKAHEMNAPGEASVLIAGYEQFNVVQDEIYSNLRYKATLSVNEVAAKWSLGRSFGALPAEVSLSAGCGGTTVPMEGSITSANDRVKYYEKLMSEFNGKGESWRRQTMGNIINDGNKAP